MTTKEVLVVGGGLAGCEAAWQLAESGLAVSIAEMRPVRTTPVHTTGRLAELVCSNSLRGDAASNAVGLLKREMEVLDSLIIRAARAAAVPAGGALAVDRERFSAAVTEALAAHPKIRIERREVVELPSGPAILATGPLTSPALHRALAELLGEEALAFFDAIAPIVRKDSIDHDRVFRASRYGKGGNDYLNSALDREGYETFVAELLAGEKLEFKDFEAEDFRYFDGCLPIEVMAERGIDTLRYGPMKPVGLTDPVTGRRPWAVVQLRQDDLAAEHWNMVGFQTKLTQGEQKRIFRTLPGLEKAKFVRFGMIHRNTFINAPAHLDPLLRLVARPGLRLAGQVTGVEGYVESAATGLMAARTLTAEIGGAEPDPPPHDTAFGGLVRHLSSRSPDGFQPANVTWGLIPCPPELKGLRPKVIRRREQAVRALQAIARWGERTGGRTRRVTEITNAD